MVYWSDDSKKARGIIIMSDKKSSVYVNIGFPVFTLLIFFLLLSISNADVSLIDLTVEAILFALFWMFVIIVSVVSILIVLMVIIAMLIGE